MHEGLQYATLAILLSGILLNRYDTQSLRKDLDAKLDKLDTSVDAKLDKLDQKLDRNRDEFLRRTDAIVTMQFDYAERIKALEVKGKTE